MAWGRQAEVINQYLRKGREIAVRGRLQTRNYTAQDGSKRYVTEVLLTKIIRLHRQPVRYGGQSYQRSAQPAAAAQTNDIPLDIDDDFSLLAEDDDVPF